MPLSCSLLAGYLIRYMILCAQVVCHSWPDALAVKACTACEVAYKNTDTLEQDLLLERCLLGAAAQICSKEGTGSSEQASAQNVALQVDDGTMLHPTSKPCQTGMRFQFRCRQRLNHVPLYWPVCTAKNCICTLIERVRVN